MSFPIPTRQQRRELQAENNKWPLTPIPFPKGQWPKTPSDFKTPIAVFRSRHFLIQVFDEGEVKRISVNRTIHNGVSWDENISWDELQLLKSQIGYGNFYAVEIYPAEDEVVNVANMRHLWILKEAPPFAWRVLQPKSQQK